MCFACCFQPSKTTITLSYTEHTYKKRGREKTGKKRQKETRERLPHPSSPSASSPSSSSKLLVPVVLSFLFLLFIFHWGGSSLLLGGGSTAHADAFPSLRFFFLYFFFAGLCTPALVFSSSFFLSLPPSPLLCVFFSLLTRLFAFIVYYRSNILFLFPRPACLSLSS